MQLNNMRIWRPINRVDKIEEYRAWQQAAKEHRLEAELAHLKAHEVAGTSDVGDAPIEEVIKDCKERLNNERKNRI